MKTLSDSIDALYDAFSEVPKPRVIEGCPCCIEKKNICTLLSKHRRNLAPEEISSYASSAFLTVGDVPDYLYFLPRIIEISCTVPGWWPDPPVTGRAIAETQPGGWPATRLTAFIELLHAIIHHAIAHDRILDDFDDWLCAIGKMGIEIEPFLAQIEGSPASLLAFYEGNSIPLGKGRLSNSFWNKDDPGHGTVLEWFHSPHISAMISEAYGL